MGNGEAKDLIYVTHSHELRWGGMMVGGEVQAEGNKEEKKWDNCNSIINKIYLKNRNKTKYYMVPETQKVKRPVQNTRPKIDKMTNLLYLIINLNILFYCLTQRCPLKTVYYVINIHCIWMGKSEFFSESEHALQSPFSLYQ